MGEFNVVPTLTHFSASKIAQQVWVQKDILNTIKYVYGVRILEESTIRNFWLELRREILNQLSLLLPEFFNRLLEDLITYTGLQIKQWISRNEKYFAGKNIADFINIIQWTPRGTINYEKTAIMLLDLEDVLTVRNSFYIASKNCLQDHLNILSEKLSKLDKERILQHNSCVFTQYWYYYLFKNRHYYNNPRMVKESHKCANYSSFKYFFQQLNDSERILIRSHILQRCQCISPFETREIILYLLSTIDSSQIVEYIENYGNVFIELWFLEKVWLDHNLFDFEWIMNFIAAPHFSLFLANCVCHIFISFPSSFSSTGIKLLTSIWRRTSSNYKRQVFENPADIWKAIRSLLCIFEIDLLLLIFEDATVEERRKIIIESKNGFASLKDRLCLSYHLGYDYCRMVFIPRDLREHISDLFHAYSNADYTEPLAFLEILQKCRQKCKSSTKTYEQKDRCLSLNLLDWFK